MLVSNTVFAITLCIMSMFMDHIAIMNKRKGLISKILTGDKTIESRWYVNRISPWNKIEKGETVWFKDSGEKVTAKATVYRVLQFDGLFSQKIMEILKTYGKEIGFKKNQHQKFINESKNKNYCILVFLKYPRLVRPFAINKAGFGVSSAWISLPNIKTIKI